MNRVLIVMGLVASAALVSSGSATAAEKVELKDLHMCCDGCAEEVTAILGKVEGISGASSDKAKRSATFTAASAKAAQKALDALAEGGFHGDPGKDKGYSFQDDSGVQAGQVKSLTVTGFHNTCAGCAKSFREAVKDVKGVSGTNAKSRVTTAEVTGEFDAAELVAALNKAGFHVKIKK
jgi:periplasmic mercuric ion binding protein